MLSLKNKKKELCYYLTNCGWQEIITYSLISAAMKEEFRENQNGTFYQLSLPKSEYHQYYRQSLVPSHLNTIKHNLAYGNRNLLFFEISEIYDPLASQPETLLILSGIGKIVSQSFHKWTQQLDFYWIKGTLENIFWRWRIEEKIRFEPTSLNYLSISQSAEIFLTQQKIGFIGQVNPLITQNYRISEPVFTAQISLTKIFTYLEKIPVLTFYQPLSNFPRSEKDLSFIFPTVIDYQQVIQAMKKLGGRDLQEVSVFDVYQNAELEQQAKKSVSFHLVFQSFTRTLQTAEVEKIAKLIGENIEKLFQAKLRDKTTKIGS
ncbi:MAG: hypothetical protein I3270_02185 [Candidatus Moeniiplasma glomeromycotorum]|nr:hypothetical protein [Candidatus Moeniiplasma glomeromycotorum]MCE8162505.1 hypothetical protein [Candidatus Moeniiplasma glomeromycotorum]MCE8166432.1 hypothetical protein [Candidatus Moeniiplasma glomeromycotorum]MCE8166917.1 hypothetical protein [Candidatus Moeniiplasma glomeromycotorum]